MTHASEADFTERDGLPPKLLRTEKQKAAARRNGARSRGPTTDSGKAIASRNAFKHGLYAQRILDWAEAPEDREAISQLLDQFMKQYRPQTAAEAMLIEELVDERLRFRRAKELEDAMLLPLRRDGTSAAQEGSALREAQAIRRRREQVKHVPSYKTILRQQAASWNRIVQIMTFLEKKAADRVYQRRQHAVDVSQGHREPMAFDDAEALDGDPSVY